MSTESVTVFTQPAQPYQNQAPAAPVVLKGNPATPAANADVSPQARWADMQRDIARSDPWMDHDTVLVRDPTTGAIVPHERVVGANGEVRAGKPLDGRPADPSAPAATAEAPGERFQVGKHAITEAELSAMLERQANDDLRKATLPATPDAYKAELPADLTLPGGAQFKFNDADPLLATAKNWAHARGLDQAAFSELLGIYAGHEAQRQSEIAQAQAAEVAKLGVNAPQRVDAVMTWVNSLIGSRDADIIRRAMVSETQIRFYETVMTRLANQGSGSFSPARREVETGTLSAEQYEKLSYSEKKDYAARASQGGRR